MINIISLGAGVQSSTMALMAAHGEITPMPDAAIFADTQAEPIHVYAWKKTLEALLPFPVITVTAGDLRAEVLSPASGFSPVPFNTGKDSKGRRQCTREYKIAPIHKAARQLAGLEPGQRSGGIAVVMWKGISWDERQRMDTPKEKWVESRFPLIEKTMTRGHCLEWMKANHYPEPPRSACTFCPYQTADWPKIKRARPHVWNDAVAVDRAIRARGEYIHPSCLPLEAVDFDIDESQDDWVNECEGMCGL